MEYTISDFENIVAFKTSRSGGKGGQSVNKVSTRVELQLNLHTANLFSSDERALLFEKLRNRIGKEGILRIVSEETRSQLLNKEQAIQKLVLLINTALKVRKKRKPTKPGKNAVESRLQQKLAQAKKKIERKKNFDY